MATLKSCLAKVKKAGYDTSTLPLRELEVSSDPNAVIDSELNALRTEHQELFTTRERLMEQLRQFSPEMNEAIQEHVDEEIAINKPARPIGPERPSKGVEQGLARTNKTGLPVQPQKQAPKELKNLEKSVTKKKATGSEEEVAAVGKVMGVLRRAQRAAETAGAIGKPYAELSTQYAVRKAQAVGVMKKIREMFPDETSNIAAMKKFQQIAKNQLPKEKSDAAPFNKRQTKQLGAFNKEIIDQRSEEVVPKGKVETSDSSQLEGVTEQEPKAVEVRIEPHLNKKGQRTELAGVVGLARRLKNFMQGAVLFRETAGGGLSTYVVKLENAEQGAYDGTPQEIMQALAKALTDGRRTDKNRITLYDKRGEAVPVNSIAVTKLGAVVDQTTRDIGMAAVEKSGKQFNAGLAYLMAEGNLTLQKKSKTLPTPMDQNKEIKAAYDNLHPFLRKVLKSVSWMTPGDKQARLDMPGGYVPLAWANHRLNMIFINKEKLSEIEAGWGRIVLYHEAGHIADAELAYKPQSEWLSADMLAKYYIAGTTETNPMYGIFKRIFNPDGNYTEAQWRSEVVAQLFMAYHMNPNKLKQWSPEGHALAERMNDELQLKSEFIERTEAERAARDQSAGRGSTGQERGPAVSQEKAAGSEGTLSNETVIDTRGTTVSQAAAFISTRKKATPDFDPDTIEQTATEQEADPDVRIFETDEAQIARSTGRATTSPELVGASILPKEKNPSNEEAKRIFDTTTQRKAFGKIPSAFIAVTNKLFGQLGIKTKVLVVDQAGAKELLAETGLPTQWKDNLTQVLNDQPVGRLMLSNSSNANERFAIVYIDTTKSPAKQQRALLHELGHIVQLAKLDQASPEIQKALRDTHELSESHQQFEEWFADNLIKWVNSKKAPKSVLDQFFKELAQVLRRVYNKFRGAHPTYEQFMDSLVAAQQLKRGMQKPASGKHRKDWIEDMSNSVDSPFLAPQEQAFYNFGGTAPSTRPGVSRKAQALLDWGKKGKEIAGEILEPPHQIFTQTVDAYMRSNGLAWLADHFHKRPDVRTQRTGPTIEQEIRVEFGQFEADIDSILNKMPGGKGFFKNVDRSDPKYAKAIQDLLSQSDQPNALAAQTRAYFEKMEKWITKNGVQLKKRKNYFPVMLDKHLWMAGHDKVVKIAMEKLGKSRVEAENMYLAVANDPSTFADMSADYDPRTTATFGHAKSREFGPKEHLAFIEFIDTDIASVVKNYTHSAVKHVVVNRHFGALGTKAGQADPLVHLKTLMTKELIAGRITQEVYDRTWNTVIPGMFGQLGASLNPGIRKLQSGVVFFQNIRLLGTAVLSSLVDPANVMLRSGSGNPIKMFKGMAAAIGELNNKEKKLFYRTLGIIRDDLTEAIVNDPTHTQFYAPKIRSLNEKFFKLNGMQGLTNSSRIYSFSVGRQYILEMAKTNNTKRLAEMGLTRQEVLSWDKRGQSFNMDNLEDANVVYALHQFVDESILRPSASMRPAWMSDQRWLLVANLKSFIFTYHETILRRLWSQVRTGELKDPAVLVPFVGFAATALAISMFGYETRRQIMHAGDVPAYARADAWDYLSEGIQRSGALGTMQFLVDSIEAESRGKMALMSMLGPTASQFEMLMTKDLSYSLPRSLPIFAQSSSLREWIR